jgi:uncharacterized protein (DUF2062 family)
VLRRIVYSKSSTSSIAGGMAIGIFVGLTPTFGFQMIPAAFLAALFRVNILAAVLAVWVTNPFTAAFIYYSEYLIGKMILPFEPGSDAAAGFSRLADRIGEISFVDLWHTLGAATSAFFSLGNEVITRFLLGSVVSAAAGSAVAYPATVWSVKYVRKKRSVGTVRRADRRLARLNAAGLVHVETNTDAGSEGFEDGLTSDRLPMIVALPMKPDEGVEHADEGPPAKRGMNGA